MANTRHIFFRDLLRILGCPGSLQNALALVAQAQAEGGSAHFNPLNTTWKLEGSTDYNKVPVQNYASWADGLRATASTLEMSTYSGLLNALRRDQGALAYWIYLVRSPWDTETPGGLTIDAWLMDCQRNWFSYATMPVAGT